MKLYEICQKKIESGAPDAAQWAIARALFDVADALAALPLLPTADTMPVATAIDEAATTIGLAIRSARQD